MRIVIISPETADPREVPAMEGFFAAGLERYHVRKPSWEAAELGAWLRALPVTWRPRIFLHQHHALVGELGLGGRHEKGDSKRAAGPSRSCHDLPSLRRYMRAFEQVIFGPVFPSISKESYAPSADFPWKELSETLRAKRAGGACRVLAIGGITGDRLARCKELGFDGAAVHGAVWRDADPVRAYLAIIEAVEKLEDNRNAA
jgi:thiamine-phosphate pyrophosphorylase